MGERLRRSRLGRLAQLGGLAGGLAGDLAGAAGRRVLGAARDVASEKLHREVAARLAESLSAMKGLPMKLGQIMSYVDGFVPPAYRDVYQEALRPLRVKAAPMPLAVLEAEIERSYGRTIAQTFARFDPDPVAAASIGQVHRAALEDGREVAVKIQYPGIAESIGADLANADFLVDTFRLLTPKLGVEVALANLAEKVREECDYAKEAGQQEELRAAWEDDPDVLIPRVVRELSTDRVLVTEWVDAPDWAKMLATATQEQKNRLGMIIYRFAFRSIYAFGAFNADPHPGNYLFPGLSRVAFLDFGCVQRFSAEAVRSFHALWTMTMRGATGPEYRRAMREAYGMPDTLDDEEWEFFERYEHEVFEPVSADRVYRFDRGFNERVAARSAEGLKLEVKKGMKKAPWEPEREGMVFLYRILFGLHSVLSEMGAEGNFHRAMRAIQQEYETRR